MPLFEIKEKNHHILPLSSIRQLFKKQYIIPCIVTILYLFILAPSTIFLPPIAGIDGSWAMAINMAIHKNFVFGKDFIFTYGPLGFLSTRFPMYMNKWHLIMFDLYMMINFAFILFYVLYNNRSISAYVLSFFTITLFGYIYSSDVVIILVWIMFFMFFYFLRHGHIYILINSILIATLLFFIKLNTGIVAIFFLYIFLIYCSFKKKLSITHCVGFIMTQGLFILLLCLWLKVSLFNYIVGSLHIINAYNDAMFLFRLEHVDALQSALLIITLYIILFFRYIKIFLKDLTMLMVYMLLAAMTYIIFKQAFVRADEHHVLTFIRLTPLFFCLLFIFSQESIKNHIGKFIVFCLFIGYLHLGSRIKLYELSKYSTKYEQLVQYVSDVFNTSYTFDYSYLDNEKVIPANLVKIIGNKSVDILPYEISYIFLNKLNYNPRPVIQSYSTYDEYLDNKNAEKYMSDSAPEFVLFQLDQIDERLAIAEEAQTKIALLKNYEVIDRSWEYLLLKKLKKPLQSSTTSKSDSTYQLGDDIELEESEELQLIKADIQYSLLGKIRRFLFQPPLLTATIQFEDGSQVAFKAIKPIANSGMLLNRYIGNNENSILTDFFITYNGKKNQKVSKIRFNTPDPWGFNKSFDVSIEYVQIEQAEKTSPPALEQKNILASNITLPAPGDMVQVTLEASNETSEFLQLIGLTSLLPYDPVNMKVYTVLKSRNKELIIPSQVSVKPTAHVQYHKDYNRVNFNSIIFKKNLPEDNYQIGIYVTKNDTIAGLRYLNRSLNLIDSRKPLVNVKLPNITNDVQYAIDLFKDSPTVLKIKGWSHIDSVDAEGSHTYLVLHSEHQSYIFDTSIEIRPDVTAAFPHLNLHNSGYTTSISKVDLIPGEYRIGFLIEKNNNKALELSDISVTIEK
jgi:hypothetical protein